MGTFSDQANAGMNNFMAGTKALRDKISSRNSQFANSTPAYAPSTPMGKPSAVSKYTNLKNLGAITTGFGDSTRFESFHPGIDVANKIGTPLNAFQGGTVVKVDTGKVQGQKGFGNRVVVRDANGEEWSYGHLNDVYVRPGQTVQKGQNFGTMGNSGSTYSNNGGTGSHLDLRIYNTFKKKYENPLQLIS